MLKTNALKLRQNLGSILKQLQKTGRPILLEKNRKPMGVIISIEDYQKRFADVESDEARRELVQSIREAQLSLPANRTAEQLIRELRGSI